jgi:hypothetical protein
MQIVKLSNVILEYLKFNDGIPEGQAYVAFYGMLNLDQWNAFLRGLTKNKAIKVSGHYITKGEDYDRLSESYASLEKLYDEKFPKE